jgi:hypothetical protein
MVVFPAGERRQRVSVQIKAKVSDGHDGFLPDQWASVHARMAVNVKPLAGRDLERARQIDPRISHEVTLPYWRAYHQDLNGGRSRLLYHDGAMDRPLEIVAPPIDVEEAHVKVTVLCREAA